MASLRTLLLIIAVALPVWVGLSLAGPNPGGVVSPGQSSVSQATQCPGDFDDNLKIDFADFVAFAGGFGARSGDADYNALMDLDGSGSVDLVDLQAFAAVFCATCETLSPPTWDRDVLVALYHATDGPNWTNNTNWLTDARLGYRHGVEIDGASRVVRLVPDRTVTY